MITTPLRDILFLDIETVPQVYNYEELPDKLKKLFAKKTAYRLSLDNSVENIYEKAGIWAEFGKVVSVAFGKFIYNNNNRQFHVKAYVSKDETKLLQNVKEVLDNFYKPWQKRYLCAHNGKEFDFPYLARRMIINNIALPEILKVHGKKPWETPFCDTMELWSFGDRKHYTSLELLCEILQIPGSKSEIDGSDVARIYYEEKDLEKIGIYCGEDVIALTNVLLRFRGEKLLSKEEIVFQLDEIN